MISVRSLQRSEGDVFDPIYSDLYTTCKKRRLLGKYQPDSFKTERLVCVETDGQTDMARHDFMWSETLSSTCYIVSDESSIPFYSTCNGYYN